MNTRPASTSSARPVKINLWLDLALFSVMMAALTPALTGLAVHEWLSIALAVAVVIHLLLHWQWLVNVVRRFFGRLAGGARLNLVLNVALFVDFTLVVFTGLMISRAALPVMGITLTGGQAWRGLHSLSANLILLIIALHVGIHWKWILGAGRRFLCGARPEPDPEAATRARAGGCEAGGALMKTLGRLVLILLAALIVVGTTYAIVQRNGAQNAAIGRGDGARFGAGEGVGRDGGGERGGREGGGLFGLFGLLKNLAVVGVIVLLVAGGWKSWEDLSGANPPSPPERPAQRRNAASSGGGVSFFAGSPVRIGYAKGLLPWIPLNC